MFLDDFKLISLTLQIQHPRCFDVWDNAGSIAMGMLKIWPELELAEGTPNQQVLRAPGVQVQTGFSVSSVFLSKIAAIDSGNVGRLTEAYKNWRSGLKFERLARASSLLRYGKTFDSIEDANAALRKLDLVRWPSGKIFDQPEDGAHNVPEITFKFEDSKSFSFLSFKTEKLKYGYKLDPPFEKEDVSSEINRLVVEFDRGLLGSIDANRFIIDEWFKGLQHVFRRDIERIIGKSI